MIRQDLNVSEFHTNLIAMITQIELRLDYSLSFHWEICFNGKDHHYQLFPTDPLPFNHSHGPLDQRNSRSLTSDRYLFHGPQSYPDSLTILPTRTQGA